MHMLIMKNMSSYAALCVCSHTHNSIDAAKKQLLRFTIQTCAHSYQFFQCRTLKWKFRHSTKSCTLVHFPLLTRFRAIMWVLKSGLNEISPCNCINQNWFFRRDFGTHFSVYFINTRYFLAAKASANVVLLTGTICYKAKSVNTFVLVFIPLSWRDAQTGLRHK